MTTTTAGRGQGGVSRGIYEFTTGHLAQPAPGAHSGVSLCFNRSVAIARDPARPLGNWSAAANRCGSLARRALPCIRSQIRPRLACRGTVPTGGGSWDLGVGRKAGHQGLAGPGEPSSPGSQAGVRWGSGVQWRWAMGQHSREQLPVCLTLALTLVIGTASVGPGGLKRELRRLFSSHPRRQTTSMLTSGFDIQPTIARILSLKPD